MPIRTTWFLSATLIFHVFIPETTVRMASGDFEQSTLVRVPRMNFAAPGFVCCFVESPLT